MGNDNGILDLETINNEMMEQRNINTKPASSEPPNTAATMNSGTMNPTMSNPAAMGAVNPAMPNPAAMGAVNPAMPNPAAMGAANPAMSNPAAMGAANPAMSNPAAMGVANPAMPNPAAMGAVNPVAPAPAVMEPVNPVAPAPAVMEPISSVAPAPAAVEPANPIMPEPAAPDFSDLELQDSSPNFNQAATSETMDSGSFTRTEADWNRVSEKSDNYVDYTDSRDNYRDSEPLNFFQGLLAFLVSFILAGVFVFLIVQFYNIEYISKLQCLVSMLPAMGMIYGFYYMTGKRDIPVPIGIVFIVLNVFISYFMFHAVMAHGVRKLYGELLSYQEAWKFVNMMRKISETKRLYYTHFASIFGVGSLSGLIFGYCGMKGILDVVTGKGRRY